MLPPLPLAEQSARRLQLRRLLWVAGVILLVIGGAAVGWLGRRGSTSDTSSGQVVVDSLVPSSSPVASVAPPAEAATPEPTPSRTVPSVPLTLTFGGDVMLGRTVETRIRANGAAWPFSAVGERLAAADLAVVNLESPFRADANQTAIDSLVLRGYPEGAAGLTAAGIDLVSLANNHIPDTGSEGVRQTQAILAERSIAGVGAGVTEVEAAQPAILERQGVRFGFLSYTYGVNFDRTGVSYNRASPARIAADVAALNPKVDVAVVLCHCGSEYQAKANATQQALAHAAVDAGADLFIGHHPHVPQPVEVYRGALIAYSLGNLVFDQLPGGNRDRSALLEVQFTGATPARYRLLPYQIYSLGQPRFLTETAAQRAVWALFGSGTGEGEIDRSS